MVSVLDFRASGPGSSPGWGHGFVFLRGLAHLAILHPFCGNLQKQIGNENSAINIAICDQDCSYMTSGNEVKLLVRIVSQY